MRAPLTVREAAAELKLSVVRVHQLLAERRIAGAWKVGDGKRGVWQIPSPVQIKPKSEILY